MNQPKTGLLRFGLAIATLVSIGHVNQAEAMTVRVMATPVAQGRGEGGSPVVHDLPAAIEVLKIYKKEHPASTEPLEIELYPGVYRVSNPIDIPGELSGTSKAPLRIYAKKRGTVWVSGGVALENPLPLSDAEKARFPSSGADRMVKYDLRAAGVNVQGPFNHGTERNSEGAYSALYVDHAPMQIARWPRDGFLKIVAAYPMQVRLDRPLPKDLSAQSDLWAIGYWSNDYSMESLQVHSSSESVDTLDILTYPRRPVKNGQRIYFENVAAGVMSRGNWYLDSSAGMIYLLPKDANRKQIVEVANTDHLLTIAGGSGINITGVNFELSRGTAIDIRDADHVKLENCEIRNIGLLAVKFTGKNGGVYNCSIHDAGSGGVDIEGGDRATLTSGNLGVFNSKIYRYSQFDWTYRPAISTSGVGNAASGNEIYDAQHVAIILHGNDHVLEYNHIHDVDKDVSDAGAIYFGRDWTERGNVIRYNFIDNISPSNGRLIYGVYLDDQASGAKIYGNVFSNVGTGVFIGGGRDNQVKDNVFVDTPVAILADDRGMTWQTSSVTDANSELRRRYASVLHAPVAFEKYSHLKQLLSDDPGAPKYNVVRRNVMIRTLCAKQNGQSVLENSSWFDYSDNICDSNVQLFRDLESPAALDFRSLNKLGLLPPGFVRPPLTQMK
ncbi:right-handed parallel beta-helix repeat-containing protein [Paraburkholderia madseniana]|uniref:right-handed parallel beta-helix repeat-containing protein n=1 Tax=Paraburkholderia TaxID=1822464 RepID=UPI0038B77885